MKNGSDAAVTGTSVSEVSDSSCGEGLIWDWSLVIYPCLALDLVEGASCRTIKHERLRVKAFKKHFSFSLFLYQMLLISLNVITVSLLVHTND